MTEAKKQFIQCLANAMTYLGRASDAAAELPAIYADREYDAQAAHQITDTELAEAGLDIDQYYVGAGMNVLTDFKAWIDAAPVRKATINKIRELP